MKIMGTGSCAPENCADNLFFEKLVDTSDEWITARTGIKNRHILKGQTLTQLAAEAARRALENAGVKASELDQIICATMQGDYVIPSLACLVQREIGANCPAFDINAACSGFLFALDIADGLIFSGKYNKILIVCADQLSKFIDYSDRSTCVLFGDGAGAVVLTRSAEPHVFYPVLNAIPDTDDVIVIKKEARSTPFGLPVDGRMEYIRMKGSEVFTYASGVMEDTLRRLLELCGDRPYTKIIPHQANEKIIDYVMRTMRLDREQFFINISEYANTSSATIPIAMTDAYRAGWLTQGDRVALVGFGSGLTSVGVVIDWTIPNKKEN